MLKEEVLRHFSNLGQVAVWIKLGLCPVSLFRHPRHLCWEYDQVGEPWSAGKLGDK